MENEEAPARSEAPSEKFKAPDSGTSSELDPDDYDDLFALRLWRNPLLAGSLTLLFAGFAALRPGGGSWIEQIDHVQFLVEWTQEARSLHSSTFFGLGIFVSLAWIRWMVVGRSGVALLLYLFCFLPFWALQGINLRYDRVLHTYVPMFGPERGWALGFLSEGGYAILGEQRQGKFKVRSRILASSSTPTYIDQGPLLVLPKGEFNHGYGFFYVGKGNWYLAHRSRLRFIYNETDQTLRGPGDLCIESPFVLIRPDDKPNLALALNDWPEVGLSRSCNTERRLQEALHGAREDLRLVASELMETLDRSPSP